MLLQNQQSNSQQKSSLPKIIHQQWKDTNVPFQFQKWRNKWLLYFPSPTYTHMLWTDESAHTFIQTHYPWFLSIYDSYPHNINRADAVRYFILYHYGGIYADLDYEPLTNFYHHLPQSHVGLIESPYYWNENTQNSLMTSPQYDLFWTDLFHVLIQNSKKFSHGQVLETTGPSLVDDAIASSSQNVYILPCENFHRVPLGEYNKETSITTFVGREMKFRLQPMSKQCGSYNDEKCHFGKHHNTVSYRNILGTLL
jgi:mannosyltransferase OCH1-like enzyme